MKKLILLVFLAGASSAWGQYGEIWFNGGKSMIQNGGVGSFSSVGNDDDVELTDGFRFGFRFNVNGDTIFGHEFQYAYSRTQLRINGTTPQDYGMAIHTGGYSYLIHATPEGTRVRPFAAAGLIFNNYTPPGSSAAQGGGSTKFGFNYGGGVKVRVGDKWAVRFDLRQYTTPKPNFENSIGLFRGSGWIRQTEIGGGFGFVF